MTRSRSAFGWFFSVQLIEFLFPLNSLLLTACLLVKLDHSLQAQPNSDFSISRDSFFALFHPFITRKKPWLGISMFLLREQGGPKHAVRGVTPPLRNTLIPKLKRTASNLLGFLKPALTLNYLGQVCHRIC